MKKLPILKPGDTVSIIAPASRCTEKQLIDLKEVLTSWNLNCLIDDDIFGDDLLCANKDEIRFKSLKNALLDAEVKAIICARGGYGCTRLIPELMKVISPISPKLFLGMSDITALNLFLQQRWQWPVVHAGIASDKFSVESTAAVKSILFGEIDEISFHGIPLNSSSKITNTLESTLTGGNLTLLQTSVGTAWQMDGRHKIIFIEEVDERGYRIDRMLEHLRQSAIFKDATAILFGDFIGGFEPNGKSLVQRVLERFAQSCEVPVVQIQGVGHGHTNFPLPLGTRVKLVLGNQIKLICYR